MINHVYKTKENWLTYNDFQAKCIAVLPFGDEPKTGFVSSDESK